MDAVPPAPEKKPRARTGNVERFEVEAINAAETRTLYSARTQIYPKRVHGIYRKFKWFVLAATLGLYYILPWIRWPRGADEPDQAILVDFAGRRFYFFRHRNLAGRALLSYWAFDYRRHGAVSGDGALWANMVRLYMSANGLDRFVCRR